MGKTNTDNNDHAPSCDFRSGGPRAAARARKKSPAPPRVRLHRYEGEGRWSGVKSEPYKAPGESWASVVRRSIVDGTRGEQTGFHLRYFEVAPGGHTSLEMHEHEHVVVVVRGRGACLVKRREYELGNMDVIYIPPGAPHCLSNTGSEPFGFFCIVDAERDRPVLIQQGRRRAG